MEHTIDRFPSRAQSLSEFDRVSAEDIAAFIDGRLAPEERSRVAAHLASDADARRELIDASRIIASAPRRRFRVGRFASVGAIAAAAVLAVVILKPGDSHRTAATIQAERRGVAEQSRTIELVSPIDGGEMKSSASFAWHAIEGASYSIAILDASGKTVFQEVTTDTLHAIPLALLKNGAGRYYWSVDALLPDGSSMTSGEREFVISPR